ncbi:hypothetical protein XM38_049330 [Halomicronema hongdechloris C2206]|uniref:Glutamine amidotransferase domain-containing protein n=2 Tax=Halomicronema hongdechloris TaxID=1209493 RepID=A0A1Z3HUI9_9CYAN|nr:hypothetical protein XM38_049330 [Halomicronema hongdechloris C2206]
MVVHQATSDPGLVGQQLRQRGYGLDMCCPAEGEPLPQDLEAYEAVVVFGGPMSANDDDTLPFIRQELHWIERILTTDTPFLGICLGAQLLARTLGAQVYSHPQGLREIGYFPLQPTVAGQAYFADPMAVYHWHQEGFELPRRAMLLAQGNWFPHQAFRYGQAYGLQFHPEITTELIHTWTTKGADQLTLPGAQPRDRQLAGHRQHGPGVAHWLQGFLERWLISDKASREQDRLIA